MRYVIRIYLTEKSTLLSFEIGVLFLDCFILHYLRPLAHANRSSYEKKSVEEVLKNNPKIWHKKNIRNS